MNIVCINSRDELNLIDLSQLACVQANGNYTQLLYIEGLKLMVNVTMVQWESIIARNAAAKAIPNTFVRLGRSVIVNTRFLTQINLIKQRITLSDRISHTITLQVPKQLLKNFRELILSQYSKS
ncbi:MAG: LytTR family transcriptional regulator DNA-binding domain-containing protein [Bacteroidales bacterium]|nr:LytTR family transcriptional regulator DNA-binding domain-containing protein [Bacteroidales bacterium]